MINGFVLKKKGRESKAAEIFQILKEKLPKNKKFKNSVKIQTYGIKRDGWIQCTSEENLKIIILEIITISNVKRVIIDSICTLYLDNGLYLHFKALNIAGVDVVLVIYKFNKWADSFLVHTNDKWIKNKSKKSEIPE
ncbi:hypothetical protein CWI39_1568p0010 [Hamiltosporidium magnivora]|uniref:Uncharacterized protein n=1 Tax=Hamiltosporidium magnivora TaxID=148818 RepID=A0A4Q9L0G5_9MICR|nr:hypothetical protein CWI39_1568p0010 [Hamiltosporidium magnivora]